MALWEMLMTKITAVHSPFLLLDRWIEGYKTKVCLLNPSSMQFVKAFQNVYHFLEVIKLTETPYHPHLPAMSGDTGRLQNGIRGSS